MTTCTWKTKVCMRHTHCLEHTAVCGKEAQGRWEMRVFRRLYRYEVCKEHAAFVLSHGGTVIFPVEYMA